MPAVGEAMRPPSRRDIGLAVLSLLGLALFGYPLLATVDGGSGAAGWPALFVYLFAVWAALIALAFLLRR